MTRIGLLRHGEVKGGTRFRGHTDDPLTEIGWEQMRISTENSDWDRVISSPLERCADFARAFTRQYSLPLSFDERIKEMYFGTWEGRTAAQLMAEDPTALERFWADPEAHPPPSGELLSQFQARVLTAWDSLVHRYSGQKLLLVTHGGVIRILLCHVQQRPLSELLQIEVKHGALCSVCVSENDTTIRWD